MGKRYKRGNHGKSRRRPKAIFIKNETEINKKINKFRKIVLNENLNDLQVYYEADKLRREIKEGLRKQERYVHNQSHKRRFVYYDQTATFKGLYVTWKKITLPTYFKVRFNFPEHLIPILCIFYRDVKRGCEPSLKIF